MTLNITVLLDFQVLVRRGVAPVEFGFNAFQNAHDFVDGGVTAFLEESGFQDAAKSLF